MSVLFHMLQEADQGRAARAEHAGAAADELLLRELLLHVAQHVRGESGGRGGARGAGAQIGLQHRAFALRNGPSPSGTGPAFDFSEYCLKPPHHCRGAEVLKSICEGVRALPARSAGLVRVNVFTYIGVRSKKATLYMKSRRNQHGNRYQSSRPSFQCVPLPYNGVRYLLPPAMVRWLQAIF